MRRACELFSGEGIFQESAGERSVDMMIKRHLGNIRGVYGGKWNKVLQGPKYLVYVYQISLHTQLIKGWIC